ncbi:MAG TPA: hypothetical protein VFS36_10050 [Chitinophagaceae bacterium]|nr:hypothetical protein [Chitinophagaceae bacterium]
MRWAVLSLVLFCKLTMAQTVEDIKSQGGNTAGTKVDYTVTGIPIPVGKYIGVVNGSPYFSENWMISTIVLTDGSVFNNIPVKIDLASKKLLFKDSLGRELIATSPASEVSFVNPSTAIQYRFMHSSAPGFPGDAAAPGWYLVLAAGKVSLYNKIEKEINETTPYGSATSEQNIITKNHYLLQKDSSLTTIKKLKDIIALLPDQKSRLINYVHAQKLSDKREADLAKLVAYYNSLVTKQP